MRKSEVGSSAIRPSLIVYKVRTAHVKYRVTRLDPGNMDFLCLHCLHPRTLRLLLLFAFPRFILILADTTLCSMVTISCLSGFRDISESAHL